MSTSIEWTQRPGTKGETWNPTTGCNKVSQGCKNCYAEVMHRRLLVMQPKKYDRAFNAGVVTHPDTLTIPLGWKKPRTVFVNSMSDLFHADVPFAFIDRVFAIMALTPQHTYQILTKRPERMAVYFESLGYRNECIGIEAEHRSGLDRFQWHEDNSGNADPTWPLPLPNVWLGTSVEDQKAADERIPHLLRTPAAVRFLSCEPLLGPISIPSLRGSAKQSTSPAAHGSLREDARDDGRIHWVITGGESGQHARPMHPDWARSLRDQCAAAGVPFFFKQWGAWAPEKTPSTVPDEELGQLIPHTVVYSTDQKSIGAQVYYAMPSIRTGEDGFEMVHVLRRVGKHASGNLLDGRTHTEYPTPSSRGREAEGAGPGRGDPARSEGASAQTAQELTPQ